MVRKLGKQRNRSVTPDNGGSVAKAGRGSEILEEDEVHVAQKQQFQRSEIYSGHNLLPKNSDALDSPFILQTSDHPVAKMATVKLMLSLAPKMQWSLHQLDVSNALLNGDLDEEIYMKLPPGYAELQGELVSDKAVCRLHKSIYGLKQASRQWFIKFSTTLLGLGFEKCHGDHTLFAKEAHGHFLVVLVYVDDILIASTDDAAVCELKSQLSSAFQLRDLGPPKFFLGIEIARTDAGISLCQRKYVLDLLASPGFSDCKPSTIPMEPNQKLAGDEGDLLEDTKQYRRLVGKLQYLSITRPDITFAVTKLAQYSNAPRVPHLQALHKVNSEVHR